MRLWSLLSCLVYLTTLLSVSFAQEDSTTQLGPDIEVTASFPDTNPFGHIVNGERNLIKLLVENKADGNVTLINIAGAIRHASTDFLIKNTTVLPQVLTLLPNVKMELGYSFYSEFKPGDVKLNIWMEAAYDESVYRVTAYDSIVTIVEPEKSLLDLKLLMTYLVVTGLLGGAIYVAYLTFVPQTKRPRKRPAAASDVSASTTATTGYQEEWIPEHHLKKSNKGALTSEDETSGTDVARKEGRKRKGKK